MITADDIAQLPLVGAAYYDKFVAENAAVARMMTRQEYIDSYVRMQLALAGYSLNTATTLSTNGTGRVEPPPTVEKTAAEVKAAVEAQK